MPLPIPQLDDRRFDELVTALRDQIPSLTKAWTDFNTSDPGIAILELWCWLAEMILYRIDRITERSYTNFLKLILDPPEPVTAEVTLTIQLPSTQITIPAGVRFATDPLASLPQEVLEFTEGGRLIFETYRSMQYQPAEIADSGNRITFPVRSKVVVRDELLGIGNGRPDQMFDLERGPVLVDEENISNDYNPNPDISVDGEPWEYVPDFLETGTGPDSKQFMVEWLTGRIRFGNGIVLFSIGSDFQAELDTVSSVSSSLSQQFKNNQISLSSSANVSVENAGERWVIVDDEYKQKYHISREVGRLDVRHYRAKGKVPPAGARIVAEQYQIVLGKQVRVDADVLKEETSDSIPDLPSSQISSFNNTLAEGGDFIYPWSEAQSTGLDLFKEKFRAITTADFEEIAVAQFNRAQESLLVPARPDNRVARAVAVPGKNLEGAVTEEPASVSVIVLPRGATPEECRLEPTPELIERVDRFLDRRRLITTRVYVVGPDYAEVSLEIHATAEARTKPQDIENEIRKRVQQFFHPLTGGAQGDGWPMGRGVYKSELFQLIESVEGVHHVNSILMDGSAYENAIDLAENQLPLITISNIDVINI